MAKKRNPQPRTIGHELWNAYRKVVGAIASHKSPPAELVVQAFLAHELRQLRVACEAIAKNLEEEEYDEAAEPSSPAFVPPGFEGMPAPALEPSQVMAMMRDSDLLTLQRTVPAILRSDAIRYGDVERLALALEAGELEAVELLQEVYASTSSAENIAAELEAVRSASAEPDSAEGDDGES